MAKTYFRNIPSIKLNAWEEPAQGTKGTNIQKLKLHYSITRFLEQCIVYIIRPDLVKPTILNSIETIFTRTDLISRSENSYIFLSNYLYPNLARKFLRSPHLKHFKYRVWTDLIPPRKIYNHHQLNQSESNEKIKFHFTNFCFFCAHSGGKAGLIKSAKLYLTAGEILTRAEIFPDVFKDFEGATLKVTAPIAPPLVVILPSHKNSATNTIQGMEANILNSIAGKFNFSSQLYTSPGGLTGAILPNGTWTGIMGEILNGKADMGLSIATSYDRNKEASFTTSVFDAFLVLVSVKPSPIFYWIAIFYPFTVTTWCALIFSIGFTIYFFKRIHDAALKAENPRKIKITGKDEKINFFRAFYLTFGSLVEQG